jgi:excisionase family DNA binding protein
VSRGAENLDTERGVFKAADDTKDGCKPSDAIAALQGKAPSDKPALEPYWGKPAVRNLRGDDGNVGIIRSPVRAIVLPDHQRVSANRRSDQSMTIDSGRPLGRKATPRVDVDESAVITGQEVADYLHCSYFAAYKLTQQGKIPCCKLGGGWRFMKSDIDKWMSLTSTERLSQNDADRSLGKTVSFPQMTLNP